MGRQSELEKLDPKVRKAFIGAIREGLFFAAACRAFGFAESTARRWVSKGEADDAEEPYLTFAAEVNQAEAESLNGWTRDLMVRAKSSEREDVALNALKFYLTKRYPAEFGDRQRLEHTGADGKDLASGVIVLPAKDPEPEAAFDGE